MTFSQGDLIALVDLPGIVHRMFHGLGLTTAERVLENVRREVDELTRRRVFGLTFTHVVLALEGEGATEDRRKSLPVYKTGRGGRDSILSEALDTMEFFMGEAGYFCVSKPRAEADDIVATYARMADEAGAHAVVMSADKDLMQCVKMDSVVFMDIRIKPHRIVHHGGCPEWIDVREEHCCDVEALWGVPPDKILDVQALAGDSTDRIPGATGIGAKWGADLVCRFGDYESVLFHADEVERPKMRAALLNPEIQQDVLNSAAVARLRDNLDLPPVPQS